MPEFRVTLIAPEVRMSVSMVSVIVPTYNPQVHLLTCLASVFSQTHTLYEVIVIDDGSNSNCASVFAQARARYPQLRLMEVHPNRGVAHARNLGAANSQGDYLAFLDHDDIWDRSKLELQANYLDCNPDCAYVTSRQRYFLTDGLESTPKWIRKGQIDTSLPGFLPGALMVRSTVFSQLGGFDESLKTGTDDVDWFFRASAAGIISYELPEQLLLKRIHDDNLSAKGLANTKELLSVVRMNLARRNATGIQTNASAASDE